MKFKSELYRDPDPPRETWTVKQIEFEYGTLLVRTPVSSFIGNIELVLSDGVVRYYLNNSLAGSINNGLSVFPPWYACIQAVSGAIVPTSITNLTIK